MLDNQNVSYLLALFSAIDCGFKYLSLKMTNPVLDAEMVTNTVSKLKDLTQVPEEVLRFLAEGEGGTLLFGVDGGNLILAATRLGKKKDTVIGVSPFLDLSEIASGVFNEVFPTWKDEPHFMFALHPEEYVSKIHGHMDSSIRNVHIHGGDEVGDIDLGHVLAPFIKKGLRVSVYGLMDQIGDVLKMRGLSHVKVTSHEWGNGMSLFNH